VHENSHKWQTSVWFDNQKPSYRELNAELLPIKPLYFEPYSKSYEQGRKCSSMYGNSFIIK